MDKDLKRDIILDNYEHPYKKELVENPSYKKINSNNESCIDNLDIELKVEDNKIVDLCFDGEACAISTSATSIMIRTLIGKSVSEAKKIIDNYNKMIDEKPYDKELLGELNVYDEIYKQPNRKTCALLPSVAISKMLDEKDK
jgi:nitrogen fixation protein NifU and related proteins